MASGVLKAFNDKEYSVEMIPFSLEKVVSQVQQLATPSMSKKRNKFIVNIPDDLPLAFGRVDECTQVIWNLLVNASTNTKCGTITLSAALDSDGVKPMIAVTVSDTGTGIPIDLLPRVFERKLTGVPGGAGIGLTLCLLTVEAHGGTIAIENGEESGVVVRFTLPIANGGDKI
jgi:signal transduction histidine kinase